MRFDNIKYVFFDIDGVLSAPRYLNKENKFVSGFSDNDWIEYNINFPQSYKNCIAPNLVKQFVSACALADKKLFCLTAEDNAFSYFSKVDFVLSNYPEFKNERDILFTSSSKLKLELIEYIAKRDSLRIDECLLVEDTYHTILNANQLGISTMHISHLLDWEGVDVTTVRVN